LRGEPAHRGGGVELLGDGDERHSVRIEQFDHLGEVGQRAGQAIHLVDDYDIDEAFTDISEQALERWPLHAAAR
jgi:hypothetical protein